MKAYRALTGDAIYGPELAFLDSIRQKFNYKSQLWVRSNDMARFPGVHLDPKEKGHMYVSPVDTKYSFIVYNADQLLNSQNVEKEFQATRSAALRTERQALIRCASNKKECSEINIEFDAFMAKLRNN